MKQRRRWINSSLFAFLYVFRNYYFNSMDSTHSAIDKYIKLNVSMLLALLSFATSYAIPSMYFYILFATIYQINPSDFWIVLLSKIVSISYILVYLTAVAGGLTGSIWTQNAHVISAVLSIFTYAMFGLITYNIVFVYLGFGTTGIDFNNFNQVSILVLTIINLLMYYFVVFMHLPTHCNFVWRLLKDQISYLSYQGAYAQTMVSHAFCNVDDVSWGTKGSTAQHGGKKYET
jgi:chitin synthase